MAFELAKFRGRVYRAYLPPPLDGDLDVFRKFASAFDWAGAPGASDGDGRFLDSARGLATSSIMAGEHDPAHGMLSERFVNAILYLRARRPAIASTLCNAHARLLGQRRSSFRTLPSWIDGRHPADAWHVAPEARHVRGLVNEVASFAANAHSTPLLRACVTMLRLLQIHPFTDGNGRLARAFALSIMWTELGPDPRFVSVIQKLYANRAMHLHRVSLSVRERDDWVDYLRLGAACVMQARSDH